MSRFALAHRIARLDPERDHVEIVHLLAGFEFPWDYVRALEMALYRTFCVPTTSRLLDATGEFRERPQRRYDDTALLMAEIMEWGYDSDRGRESLRRVNRFHRHYDIANDDFLYVLTTFHLEPIRWIERYGWRRMTALERDASFYFWREVGRRMAIRDIPPTRAAFEQWSVDHERRHFRYDDANRRVAESTRELFASWFPRPTRPLVRAGIHAMLDEPMRAAFGFPRPLPGMRGLVSAALRARGLALRAFPARTHKGFLTTKRHRSWPRGYEIAALGPPPLLASREADAAAPNGCPWHAAQRTIG